MREIKSLSKVQQEILQLLNNGWELGRDKDFRGRCWMQQGGLGKGGKARNVNCNTFYALYSKGYIAQNIAKNFPTQHYHLTDKGRFLRSDL